MELKNPKHEMFCQLYAYGKGVWGNATRCYLEVYPSANYKTALSNGPALARRYRWGRIAELFDSVWRKSGLPADPEKLRNVGK